MRIPQNNNLSPIQEEVLGILQEEAAEVIQELSKIRRSGIDFCRRGGDIPNSHFVRQEMMDFQLILELAIKAGIYTKPTSEEYETHRLVKFQKLRDWSRLSPLIDDIFEEENIVVPNKSAPSKPKESPPGMI